MNTMQRTILILSLLALSVWCALAVVPPMTSLRFTWDKAPSHDSNIEFVMKWGTSTNETDEGYYNNVFSVGTNTTCTVTNPTTGFLYFQVYARHVPTGLLSLPSNMHSDTNLPAAPLDLRATGKTTSSVQIEGRLPGDTNWFLLATVENGPVSFQQTTKSLLMRAKLVGPPPLP